MNDIGNKLKQKQGKDCCKESWNFTMHRQWSPCYLYATNWNWMMWNDAVSTDNIKYHGPGMGTRPELRPSLGSFNVSLRRFLRRMVKRIDNEKNYMD